VLTKESCDEVISHQFLTILCIRVNMVSVCAHCLGMWAGALSDRFSIERLQCWWRWW